LEFEKNDEKNKVNGKEFDQTRVSMKKSFKNFDSFLYIIQKIYFYFYCFLFTCVVNQ